MNQISLSRRGFLTSACCLAAAPIFTPVTFAAMPGDNRFVTIVLRGAMDGLDLVQPFGDAGFAALRPTLALTPDKGLIDLDGHFGLNPAAAELMPLWKAKELANTLLNDTGVVTIGGPDFGIRGEGYLRLSYANSTENILKALDRMGDFLSKRKAA